MNEAPHHAKKTYFTQGRLALAVNIALAITAFPLLALQEGYAAAPAAINYSVPSVLWSKVY